MAAAPDNWSPQPGEEVEFKAGDQWVLTKVVQSQTPDDVRGEFLYEFVYDATECVARVHRAVLMEFWLLSATACVLFEASVADGSLSG